MPPGVPMGMQQPMPMAQPGFGHPGGVPQPGFYAP